MAFLVFISIVWVAVRVGVDPYHEGALFPSAVGVAQGLNIFSEVNNQYGFVYALVQSPLLLIIGNYLIITRIVGAIVVIASAFICYLLVRKNWEPKIAFFVTLVCLALNPAWSYLSQKSLYGYGAWINQYGVLLLMGSTYLFLEEIEREEPRNYIFFVAGGLSLFSTFVRLEFSLVWVLQSSFLFLQFRRNKLPKYILGLWLIGGFSVGVASLAYLVTIGSLSDFFKQLVLVWFSAPPNSAHLGLGNLFTFGVSCVLFILFFYVIYLLSTFRIRWIWIIIFSSSSIFLLANSLKSINHFSFKGKMIGPYLQTAIDGFLLNYSSVLVLLISVKTLLNLRSNNSNLFPVGFLQITCIGLLVQLHNVNAAYIYMFNPILIAWFMYWIYDYKDKYPKLILGLRNSAIVLVASSLFISFPLVFKTSYSFNSPALKGMSDYSLDHRNEIDSKFEILKRYVDVGQLYFDCPLGLFSVSEKGLYAADKWTWNEIPREWLQTSVGGASKGQFLLRCMGGQTGAIGYDELIKSGEIRLVSNVKDFILYQFE